MTQPKPVTPPPKGFDRFEALRRAQAASEALDKGVPIPKAAKLPVRGGLPFAQAKPPEAPPLVVQQPGLIYSQPGRPPAHVVAAAVSGQTSLAGIRVSSPGSAFERLRMGQQRLGRASDKGAAESEAGTGASGDRPREVKALGKSVFQDISREARLAGIYAMLDIVAAYYKAPRAQMDAERQRLAALPAEGLDAATKTYEFTSSQVLILTSEAHAQKKILATNKAIRTYYDSNGTTADQIEDMNAIPEPVKPGRRPRN